MVSFVRSIATEAAVWTIGFAPLDSVIGVVVADVIRVSLDVDEGDASCPTFVLSGEGFETERANALVFLWYPHIDIISPIMRAPLKGTVR